MDKDKKKYNKLAIIINVNNHLYFTEFKYRKGKLNSDKEKHLQSMSRYVLRWIKENNTVLLKALDDIEKANNYDIINIILKRGNRKPVFMKQIISKDSFKIKLIESKLKKDKNFMISDKINRNYTSFNINTKDDDKKTEEKTKEADDSIENTLKDKEIQEIKNKNYFTVNLFNFIKQVFTDIGTGLKNIKDEKFKISSIAKEVLAFIKTFFDQLFKVILKSNYSISKEALNDISKYFSKSFVVKIQVDKFLKDTLPKTLKEYKSNLDELQEMFWLHNPTLRFETFKEKLEKNEKKEEEANKQEKKN